MFGELIYLPMLWLLWVVIKGRSSAAEKSIGHLMLLCWLFVPLLLLSMAATKRSNYLLVAAPAFFILTALFMRVIIQKYQGWNFSGVLLRLIWLALLILPIRYSIERTKFFSNRDGNPIWVQGLKELAGEESLDPAKTLIFNDPHYIEAMFYTGFTAYSWMPINRVYELKAAGWRVFEQKDGKYLPW